MPPHLAVATLRDLAQYAVGNFIVFSGLLVNTLCEDPSDSIERYLSVLPPNIREDVLHSILVSEALGSLVRFYSLKVLLDGSVKSLKVGPFPETYYSQILDVIAAQGTGLLLLDLRGVWIKGDDCVKLCDFLKAIPTLRVLRAPHVATDAVLSTIGSANKSLQILDVSGESPISLRGIAALCACNHELQILDIGRPGDSVQLKPSTVASLIKHLPNLSTVGSYSFVGQSLVWLVNNELWDEAPLKLRYVHDTGTDLHTMNTITRMCPALHSIYLDRPQKDTISYLQIFQNLIEVKLARFDCRELSALLAQCGSRFKVLNLVLGRGVLDVGVIAEYCTQIRKLSLYKVEHLVYFNQVPFDSLKKLSILYATMSRSCLKYLVSSSPKLEHLTLYCNFLVISDDVVNILFTDISCSYLRTVWISNATTLTKVGLETLLAKCPKLTELGYLESWGLSLEDIEELRCNIKTHNYDLYLTL